MSQGDILLGSGVFSIVTTSGAAAIEFLARGGSFHVEREFRTIEADGDHGPVMGRVRKTGEVPTLTLNALEIPRANLPDFFPPSSLTTTASTVWSPTSALSTGDYQYQAIFTGSRLDGVAVQIALSNAINMEPLDMALVDKEEVVPKVVFTGCYTSSARTTAPWAVTYTS